MTIKERLHRLVDELAERDEAVAAIVLDHLRSGRRTHRMRPDQLSAEAQGRLIRLVAELLPEESTKVRDETDRVLQAFMEAPEDDEPLTPEELEALEEGAAEIARGEGLPWSRYLALRQGASGR